MTIRFTASARKSITDQANWYASEENAALGLRWRSAVVNEIYSLQNFPNLGTPCHQMAPALHQLRRVWVIGFPFIIYYLVLTQKSAIVVIHVLHERKEVEDLLQKALTRL